MQALELMERLMSRNATVTPLRPAPVGPAQLAFEKFEREMQRLGEEQHPHARLVEQHSATVDAYEAARRQLDDAKANLLSLRADALNGDAAAADVARAQAEVSQLSARVTELEPQAMVAAVALKRAQQKVESISAQVRELDTRREALVYAKLIEEIETCFAAEDRAETERLRERLGRRAVYAEALRRLRVPGAVFAGAAFYRPLELPAFEHVRGYEGLLEPVDLITAARAKATALLRQYGVHAPP
jgi:myosin heavy subunit